MVGQEPADGVVDVGMGVRAAVAAFNERSLALCRSAGFRPVRDLEGTGGRTFRELVLQLWHREGEPVRAQ